MSATDLLDDDQQQRLADLVADPDRHLGALRDDLVLQAAIARADVVPRLTGWFTPDERHGPHGWALDPERSGPVGPASAVVAWSFAGEYTEAPPDAAPRAGFNGVLALGQRLVLPGVTFLGARGGRFRLRRHIDWMGLYTQLGLSMNWRTPLDAARRPRQRDPGQPA